MPDVSDVTPPLNNKLQRSQLQTFTNIQRRDNCLRNAEIEIPEALSIAGSFFASAYSLCRHEPCNNQICCAQLQNQRNGTKR